MANAPEKEVVKEEVKDDGKTEFTFPDETAETDVEVKTEETEVEVIDDTPEKDRGHKVGVSRDIPEVSDEELAAYSGNVQKRIKELSFARHDERRQREALQRQTQELEKVARATIEENQRLKNYVQSGEQVYVGAAKAAATAKLEVAKSKFKVAHEAFDADAMLTAQQELTSAQLELAAAENFKPMLQSDENRDRLLSTEQAQPDERAVKWQQKNLWFGRNEEATALALAAHKRLVDSGVDPRTELYYERIDARIREKFPEIFESPSAESKPHRKPASVVAPTTRSSSAKKITLTQTQVALAKKFGITPEEYAKQVALLENADGR